MKIKARMDPHIAARLSDRQDNGRPSNTRTVERVLFVTPRYFPYMGGVENHVYQVARRMARQGVDVTVLTADPSQELPRFEINEGVHIQRAPAWPRQRDYYFAPSLYRVIAAGGWQIMHLQSYHTLVAPLAMLAARQRRIPYVVTFHGGGHSSQLRNSFRTLHRKALQPLFARAARLVATAHFEIEQYGRELDLPPEKFILIPNGADIGNQTAGQEAQLKENTIVSIGRLERYKGHHRILAAMPNILQRRPDTRLWIAGEGPYRAQLERQAERLGVASHVEIRAVPVADRQGLVAQLSRSRLVVLLSEFETHPMAALEAAQLGLPLLVADTSGLSELVDQGIARSVPLDSKPELVAQAVLSQLEQPSRPTPVKLPTWDACTNQLLELYTHILNGSPVEGIACAS